MTINLSNDKLVITFKYDPKILSAIRSVPGRKFDVGKKRWEVPVENALECINALMPLGLTPTLEVKRLAEQQQVHIAHAELIRSQPADYAGDLPLFDFQKVGVKFLKELPHALLADVPGLGKSIQTIAALEEEKGPHLILVPASLKYSWKEEIGKWIGVEPLVIDGDKKTRSDQWKCTSRYTIANYELLLHDWTIMPKNWNAIVCDEATRISNPAAKTTKLLKQLNAKKKIALTGTPISNSPEDIFSLIDWLAPRFLGSYWQFLERYAVREDVYHRIVGYKNLPELADRISRFMLRRTKEEVLKDLPPKLLENVLFELSEKEKKLYRAVREEIAKELEDTPMDAQSLNFMPVKMLRLKQLTDHSSLLTGKAEHSSKLEVLRDILQPIVESGSKAIIFTQFAQMAKLLLNELNKYEPRMIIGEISAEDRQKHVLEFREDPRCKLMIMTEAGAYGLNLQAASYVVHYDLPWSVAKLMQREDRAHRIGQTKPVTVYTLTARNTIDEYVAKVLHKKQKISVGILGDGERLEDLGMSPEDIKEILRL